jgi:hypothetical protein
MQKAPKRRKSELRRDYFDEYCNRIYPDWDSCKRLAKELFDNADDELLAQIEAYRQAVTENDLYKPFEYLANRAFEAARDELMNAQKLGLQGVDSSTQPVPNFVAVPTFNRPISGCADKRK